MFDLGLEVHNFIIHKTWPWTRHNIQVYNITIAINIYIYILTLDPPPCVDLTMFTQFRGVLFSLHLMDLCPDEVLVTCSLLFMVFTGTNSLRVLRTGKDTEHPIEKFSIALALIYYIFFTFLEELILNM